MKKILSLILLGIIVIIGTYFAFVYYASYSEGTRAGELIKISRKGVLAKTWEGEISQGISGAQIFKFSIENKEKEVIQELQRLQGHYVKLTYFERYKTFFWLGDTKYFIIKVEETSTNFNIRK